MTGRAWQLDGKVLQLDSGLAPAYHLRAEMLWELPEYDPEAPLADARKSVELGPNGDLTHCEFGHVLFSSGISTRRP